MAIIRISQSAPDAKLAKAISQHLLLGGVAVIPTDTIYGFSCLADSPKAANKIYKLKKRPAKQPSLVLISGFCMLKRYCNISASKERYLRSLWLDPKSPPTTVILESRGLLSQSVEAKKGALKTLAVRLPKSRFLLKLIKATRVPLLSTSVNYSGQAPLLRFSEIVSEFGDSDALLVDGGAARRRRSSRILDLSGDTPEWIRK